MEGLLARIKKDKEELDSYIEGKEKDVAILNQVLEPVKEATDSNTESVSKLTEVMEGLLKSESKEKSYFDKDFNKKLIDLISQILKAFQTYKQQDISGIASEIKSSNENIFKLLNTPNQSDEVIRMLSAFLNKQSIAFEKLTQSTDYSDKFDKIITALSNKENGQIEKLKINYQGEYLHEVIPIYKK